MADCACIERSECTNDSNANTNKEDSKESKTVHQSDICRWWLRGKCLYGDTCNLKHPPSLFGTKTSQMLRKEHLRQNNEKNKKRTHGSKKHWGKKKKTKKEAIFRQWLLDNFGRTLLRQSSKYGILDIAGGKGVISFEFVNLNGIKSTVCDPRQHLTLKRCTKAMMGGYLHRNKLIAQRYIDCPLDECIKRTPKQIKPQHLRLFFDEKLIDFMDIDCNDTEYDNKLDELCNYQLKQFKKFNKDDIVDITLLMDGNDSVDMELTEREIDVLVKRRIRNDCVKMMDLMRNCCVVIGMHPDYATEFIIDFALKYKKAFAVLPCCVFPKSFPHRKLNGKDVRQYADFCDYLTEKHEEISQCTLTLMGGQNRVIYWKPTVDATSSIRQTMCELI